MAWEHNNKQTTKNTMKFNTFVKIIVGAVLVSGVFVQAQDIAKVNPTGTYIWTTAGRNGGPDRTNTLTLKWEGDKLTGKLAAPGRGAQAAPTETDITDGKLAGADISFSVVRDFNGNTMTSKYSGKLADGTIKGKIDTDRNGQTQSRDWEAKKQ
jgi:hypothetical protein